MPFNLPNLITLGRLLLAIFFFVLVSQFDVDRAAEQRRLLDACVAVFIIAALTDALDGYLARARNEVTALGRILDPFVDKVLICGAYIYFAGPGFLERAAQGLRPATDVDTWMVVLIIGRELLVTGLRGFTEANGRAFAANLWGKLKMVLQSVTVVVILVTVGHPGFLFSAAFSAGFRLTMVWLTVTVTALSLLAYLWQARQTLLGGRHA